MVALLSALCLLAAAGPAHAADADLSGDRVVVKGPLEVPRGETVADVVVIDGEARVAGGRAAVEVEQSDIRHCQPASRVDDPPARVTYADRRRRGLELLRGLELFCACA